jgi:hypothetical protein
MRNKTRNICAAAIIGCIGTGLILLPGLLHGFDAGTAPTHSKLVMHEWGTFTSFSGSDGVNLEFRPLVTRDLPRFVMDSYSQPGSGLNVFLKDQFVALQRMETPVTYFYTDVPRTVNVRVDFPHGLLTEWYPVVKQLDVGKKKAGRRIEGRGAFTRREATEFLHLPKQPDGKAFLDWGSVRLTPPKQFANVRVRGAKNKPIAASLPAVDAKDHYGRARETDSAIVETVDVHGGSHFEKFLFYRGVGNFELPIKLAAFGNDRFEVTNSSDDASGALMLVRIENRHVRFTRIDPLRPRSAIEIDLPKEESSVDRLAEAMTRELTAAGLYEKESLAMVNTWRSSWFGENGTRLLYLVPGKLTEKILPLKIDPSPDERVRVLVGRLETITPEDVRRLTRALVGDASGKKPKSEIVNDELKSLGRFAEPAIQFVISQTSDPATRSRLEAIRAQVRSEN